MKREANATMAHRLTGSPTSPARGKARHRGVSMGEAGAPARYPDPRVGTRSVNTLSTAQLERKRANDREAQRIIRQRTKEHIEDLERQVAELPEVKDQLSKSQQRNVELEAQVASLQRQLAETTPLLQWRQQTHELHTSTDVGGVYVPRSAFPTYFSHQEREIADSFEDQNPLPDSSGMFSTAPTHGYPSSASIDTRPMYTSYDTQMVTSASDYGLPTPTSFGPPMTGMGYSYGTDVQFGEKSLPMHPASSAPLLNHNHSTQSLPATPMPDPRYQYNSSYSEPWIRTRPG